jgi:hypothetical protein
MMEPQLSFSHATAKLEWSARCVNSFRIVKEEFEKEKPYTIVSVPNLSEPGNSLKVGLKDPLDARFALIAGDTVFNLRSLLDYAWMGLVRAATDKPTPTKSTLPIADNKRGLLKMIDNAPIGAATPLAKRLLVEVLGAHRDFSDGGNPNLVALNELSNWNKHNLITTTVGVTKLRNLAYVSGNHRIEIGELEVKGEVGDIANLGGAGEANLEFTGEPRVEILFGGHGALDGRPVLEILQLFLNMTHTFLGAFYNAFPSKHPEV